MHKYAFVDVETTGGSPQIDRVIDIGIVLADDNMLVSEWSSLVNPETHVSPFISQLTGIQIHELEMAPPFRQLAEEVYSLLEDRILVAHNARFDYAFLKHEFYRLGTEFAPKQLCTVRLSRALYPQERRHNLDAVCQRFGVNVEGRHRALPDAKALWYFLECFNRDKGRDEVKRTVETILKRPSMPSRVKQEVIDGLPRTVGVYLFYDSQGLPLYVGKSVDIRQRVLSHFYEDVWSTKELRLKQLTRHVEARVCAGELEALLVESQLVKDLQPVFNQQLRRLTSAWTAQCMLDEQGYMRVVLERCSDLSEIDRSKVVLTGRSKRGLEKTLTKLVSEHNLCPKLCGLETSRSSCFAYQLENCYGACIGAESVLEYNQRVEKAFLRTRISDWTFGGPIVVYEHNENTEQETFIVVDQWMIKGIYHQPDEVNINQSWGTFRLDEYAILKRLLLKGQVQWRPYQLFADALVS